ncbi:WxL domain-containing protein [Enterococcus sp. ZJ1668]|uniref:WxL domain-containing protein n=1 Tax=Enterococcus sp. ZJ1668 TaxID=2709402 RepID=UPI0013ED746B|nr:WxL domain-containing protein [Enterococcus sp. ZJ1668]
MKKSFSFFSMASLFFLSMLPANVTAAVQNYDSRAFMEFKSGSEFPGIVDPENPDPNHPVYPEDPTNPDGPEQGTKGPLSIDFASSFDFGNHEISNKDQSYFARPQTYKEGNVTPNYVQITDDRGTGGGWVLKIKQKGQFTATEKAEYETLDGAEILLTHPKLESNSIEQRKPVPANNIRLDPNGAESVVITAPSGTGMGTWVDHWGEIRETTETDSHRRSQVVSINDGVILEIPGTTPKSAVTYRTQLIWTIADIPET